MTTTQIVLVPGFWLGQWAWDEVRAHLERPGREVVALSLPGRGTPGGLQDQADAVGRALDGKADRRVLVVHSGAALAGTMVIDRHPEMVDHVVWVDTAPVADGHAMDAEHDDEWLSLEDVWDEEWETGSFRDLTNAQLDDFRTRAVPESAAVVTTAVSLADDRRHDVPGTVVCTAFGADDYRAYAEQGVPFLAALPQYRRLRYVSLPTGHWPMWSRPAELAQVIAEAADGLDAGSRKSR